MALVDLILGIDRVTVSTVTLDCTLIEEHSSEVELTDHPVERGADITDHKRSKPRALKLTGIISNTPVELGSLALGPRGRAEDAWAALKEIQAGDELIDVFTTLESYSNMQIVSLHVPRDAKRGNVLEVTIDLREVIQVDSETVAVEPDGAGAVKNLGRQPTPPAPEPARQSLLSKLAALFPL